MGHISLEITGIRQDVIHALKDFYQVHGVPLQLGYCLGILLGCCSLTPLVEKIQKQSNRKKRRKLIDVYEKRKLKLEEAVAFLKTENERVRRNNKPYVSGMRRAAHS